jgi:hypothetical protein
LSALSPGRVARFARPGFFPVRLVQFAFAPFVFAAFLRCQYAVNQHWHNHNARKKSRSLNDSQNGLVHSSPTAHALTIAG